MEKRTDNQTLRYHLQEVLAGNRRFENASQSVSRMILEKGVEKVNRGGKIIYDYLFFRQGKRHIIGWFDEINALVNFIKGAAEGRSSKERAFVLVGQPGNGKTFFVQYLCDQYQQFIARKENRRYTFEFVNLDKLGYDEHRLKVIQSQTLEDPLILAMNLFDSEDENKKYLAEKLGFDDKKIDQLYENYRPLGACTEYFWKEIVDFCEGDVEKALEFVRVIPAPLLKSQGLLTGKYPAGEKITSSAVDLLGEEDVSRLLYLPNPNNPYRIDVRKGALARVGGGGVHFSDEIFKNKRDLINVYLQVIQNRRIEKEGFLWPLDTLIIATSNDYEYNQFIAEKGDAPIKDRCDVCFVSHNTDYKLQQELTLYALGEVKKTTVTGEDMHMDPNLNYATSVGIVLTRLPRTEKLTPVETMKLEAGETAGDKSVRTLAEIKEELNAKIDVTARWGQKGLSHRDLGRAFESLAALSESHEGKCFFAKDIFKALERVILDYVAEATDQDKFSKDLAEAKKLYRKQIKTSIFNAYRDDPEAVRNDVMAYVNMIIGIDSDQLGPDKIWKYKDPQTDELKALKIDEKYIDSVEERLGRTTKETKEAFRNNIRKVYGQKRATDPNYDFMDNEELVKAITEVKLESDVASAGSLVGALTNRTNEENVRIYNRMVETMSTRLGYCPTCAQKTIEYFCEKVDED